MAVFSLGDASEARLVFVDSNPDGKVCVRQVSEGCDTSLCYGTRRHVETLTFRPTDEYGLDDVTDDLRRRGDDFYISDLADTLDLWEIPFARSSADSE